ncbi:hypothetical protein BN2475_140005 [Paraburkholderia ribeironis]|uniref:Transposase n=1 Tax=Paraburkholderia ribeironis TaxID=1247936 RepID=A0A1N7RSI7_9BURK|nr:hypothetical protein BN2475_140005 [Paraburkholderia ribeironis]
MLPTGFGCVYGVTHDSVRHGTATLVAALNQLNGAVLATCKPRHRHQEFLSFLREIGTAVPAELEVTALALPVSRPRACAPGSAAVQNTTTAQAAQ